MLIDEGEDGDDLGVPEQNFAPDLDASIDPDATLPYMQSMDLDATLLYMPGDDTDSSILLDRGNNHVLIDNDDTENISQSAPGQVGRSICLLGFWISLSRAPALMVIILVYKLYGYCQCWCYLHTCISVYGKSVHISVCIVWVLMLWTLFS